MNLNAIAQLQKRWFAWGMAKANGIDPQAIALHHYPPYHSLGDLKQDLFHNLSGVVLEIGPGAGANFAYLPRSIRWIGVEPNPFMHSYLLEEAARQGHYPVQLYEGSAEHLPIADNSVDRVISTHVLCSVNNQQQAIQEIRRVLKPGGTFLFIEHVAGDPNSWTRGLQNTITPLWKTVFDNCHPNRETGHILDGCGFEEIQYQHFQLSVPIVHPHIAGRARKALSY